MFSNKGLGMAIDDAYKIVGLLFLTIAGVL